MTESSALLDQLRLAVAGDARAAEQWSPGSWLTQGLGKGQIHELLSADDDGGACVAGFAVAVALAARATPVLWLRTEAAEKRDGRLHATGLIELGLPPHAVVLVVVADEAALLRAAADAARCSGLGTLMVETRGRAPGLDLTATRRLQLAAEASGVTVLLLRVGATPAPSAAATRWGVEALPSQALDADAPGRPAFEIELQRRRGGPAGQRWCVEWNREQNSFEQTRAERAALPGAGVPLAPNRTAAVDAPAPFRRAG